MPASADRQLALRLLGAGGLVAIAVIHLLDLPSKLDETPYLGVLYLFGPIATSLLATALIVGSRRVGWLLAAAIAAATAVGYCLSRTTGLPDADDDIGNWAEPLGIASLIAEGFVVLLAAGYLAATRRRTRPTRPPATLYPADPTEAPTTPTQRTPANPEHH